MNRCLFVLIITLLFLLNKSFGQTSIEFNYTIPADNNWKSVNQNGMGFNSSSSAYYLFNYNNKPNDTCKNEYFGELGGFNTCNDVVCIKRAFLNQWNEMPGNVLRFPGGSTSQLYHSGINDYDKNAFCPATTNENYHLNENNNLFYGYGVKNQNRRFSNCLDCEYIHEGYAALSNEMFGSNVLLKNNDSDHPRNILFDYIELIKEKEKSNVDNSKTKVLYVINLLTHFYAGDGSILENPLSNQNTQTFQTKVNENLNAIRAFLDNGIEIEGIEMGNELNLGQAHSYNISVVDYVNLVKYYVDLIRSDLNPKMRDLKIGVVSQLEYAPESNFVNYNCNFNVSIDKISVQFPEPKFSTNDFKIFNCCWNKYLRACLENPLFYSGEKPLFDAFIFHAYPQVVNGDFKAATNKIFNKINDFTLIYNSNYKEMVTPRNYWFTEWNKQSELNDFLNPAFILDFNTQMMIYNAQNPNSAKIEYSTFHNLLGGGYSVLNQFSNNFEPKNSFTAFQLMKQLKSQIPNSANNSSNEYHAYVPDLPLNYTLKRIDPKNVMFKLFKRDKNIVSGVPFSPCNEANQFDYFILYTNNTLSKIKINGKVAIDGVFQNLNLIMPNIYYYKFNTTTKSFDFSKIYQETVNYQLPPMSMGIISCEIPNINTKRESEKQSDLSLNTIDYNTVSVYPNPTNGLTNIIFNADKEGVLNFYLSDVTGRIIMNESIIATNGINNLQFDLNGKPSGIYFVTLSDEGFKQTYKLIVYE